MATELAEQAKLRKALDGHTSTHRHKGWGYGTVTPVKPKAAS